MASHTSTSPFSKFKSLTLRSVITAGILRSIYLYRIFHETYDVTWVGYLQWIWTVLENDFALIASCGPSLRPYLTRYLPDSTTPGDDPYGSCPARTARCFSPHSRTQEVEDGPSLPIQTPQEQELASMESRIGSLMKSSRDGSVTERSQFSYFDDARSGTFIASDSGSESTKDWPLPGKSY